ATRRATTRSRGPVRPLFSGRYARAAWPGAADHVGGPVRPGLAAATGGSPVGRAAGGAAPRERCGCIRALAATLAGVRSQPTVGAGVTGDAGHHRATGGGRH